MKINQSGATAITPIASRAALQSAAAQLIDMTPANGLAQIRDWIADQLDDLKVKKLPPVDHTGTVFEHWTEYPEEDWRWPNFQRDEMACKGTGRLMLDSHAMDCLQDLRDMLSEPLVIVSAYRSKRHNRNVGGAKRSQHMNGCAFDVSMSGHDPHQFEAAARECGFTAFGYYPAKGFMHIDTRDRPATWGDPFPRSTDDPEIDWTDAAPASGGSMLDALARRARRRRR